MLETEPLMSRHLGVWPLEATRADVLTRVRPSPWGQCPVAFSLSFLFFFCLFGAAPEACGGSQARGQIGATAADLRHSHTLLGSEPRL